MNKKSNPKEKIVSFSVYFMGGFFIGLLISLIGGFFHNAPMVMWKEALSTALIIDTLSGIWGDRFLDWFFKILKYVF